MKKYLLLFVLTVPFIGFTQTPCEGGFANEFPCNGYDLQSRITQAEMNAGFVNDSWGWTDPQDGKEYALIGLDNGTAFIDISDPINAVYLGKLPTHTGNSSWRDIKVLGDYAFIVSEAGGHGMQVFDLTELRSVASPPVTFSETAHYAGFGNAHNIVINPENQYAYGVGTDTFSGGLHFVDISDPLNPVAAGGWDGDGYTHDAQIVTYNGPDTRYTGAELVIGSNGPSDRLVIVDITDKNNPVNIASFDYSNIGYAHQGWFTEDQRYFLLGDEFDEFNVGFNSRTIVFDFLDLEQPVELFEYFGPTPAVDHNGYVKGDTFYLANYSAGLRVIDVSDVGNQTMIETGYFDISPSNDDANTSGAWNVYPFFDSENIVISGGGAFTLVRDNSALSTADAAALEFTITPNPVVDNLTITSLKDPISQIEILNVLGQLVQDVQVNNASFKTIATTQLSAGMYLVRVNGATTKRLIVK